MRKNCLGYPVECVNGIFDDTNSTLADTLREVTGRERPRILLVADQNVVNHVEGIGTAIGRWMQSSGIEMAGSPVVLPGGEKIKAEDIQGVRDFAKATLKAQLGRDDCVVALGGGALLDVAGYVAAQVRGGTKIVRLPTTPGAMMDAAFAEYAALDAPGVKDAYRVPSVPAAVVIDTSFCSTVLDGVWKASFAAALRYALVTDGAWAKRLVEIADGFRDRDDLDMVDEMVTTTLELRRKKGGTDFAMWSALRLEAMSCFKLPHGYAVAIGVALGAAYASLSGLLKDDDRKLVMDALKRSGAMDGVQHSRHLLGQGDSIAMGLDAWKLSTGSEEICLPKGIGKSTLVEKIDRDTMKRALNMLK